MWIVLLDHSGSMGDPFEAADAPSRRAKIVDAERKLDAATEVLREELQELRERNPSMPVAIFAFTDHATLVYEGAVEDRRAIDHALDALIPDNGTNIAAALNAAADYKEPRADAGLAQLILVSDGKSDRVQAMAAARRCVECHLSLSMLLIDPTDEGKAFARDVVRSVGGRYETVASRQALSEAAQQVSASYAADLARADEYLKSPGREAKAIQKEVADRELVKFTAGYPGNILPGHDYPLFVYVHLDSHQQEVLARLEEAGRQFAPWRRGEADASQRIPFGTRLEVTPRIASLAVNPPQQRITWTGSMEELSFRAHYAGPQSTPAPPCSGFIDISTGGLLIAQIPVSMQVAPGQARYEQRTVEMFSRVFASYSHLDEPIVRACKEAYRGLGIHLFVDKDDIVTGQRWRNVIRQSIADHDLFQLFWSEAAANSSNVADEWMLAKEIAPTRTNDFIRPLFWTEPMPTPPQALQDLHFARLDVSSLQVPATTSAQPGTAQATPRTKQARLQAAFPIIDAVDTDLGWVQWLQERMAEVVPFLEDLAGVRYFPPVTFLVDEHIVQSARAVLTTDAGEEGQGEKRTDPVLDILGALALGFHVGRLLDPDTDWDRRAAFFDADSPEAEADYQHVINMAEYIFAGPVTDYLSGRDVLRDGRRTLGDLLQAIVDGGSEYHAAEVARQALEEASPWERAAVADVATESTLEALGSFRDAAKQAAAARVLNSDLPRLADQYGIFEFFHQTTPHSLRHHGTFPEYLADFLHHWLGYVRVARRKRPGAVVDIGYAIRVTSLEWLQRTHPNIEVLPTHHDRAWRDDAPVVGFQMPIESYERCVECLSESLLSMLSGPRPNAAASLVSTAVASHGIYIPAIASRGQAQFARWLAALRWPANAALPGQHKVLLCMNPVERLEEKLIDVGWTADEAHELARRFSLSVLVHEHFHAAVATGLDQSGHPALGAEHLARWDAARPLNESLAVWCELHHFRDDAKMRELIYAYISSGAYPVWPYRGAEAVESIFATGGTPAVRGWMRFLRDDPENAQRKFDEQVSFMNLGSP